MLWIGDEMQLSLNCPSCDVTWYDDYYNTYIPGNSITVSHTSAYWPIVSNYWGTCGDAIDTFQITYANFNFDLGPDISGVCETTPITLFAYGPYIEWQDWSTGETGMSIVANQSGLYTVTVSSYMGLCSATDQINIDHDEVPNIDLGSDTNICEQGNYTLWMGNVSDSMYWLPGGQTTPELIVDTTGTYIALASNACGDFSDTVDVAFLSTPAQLPYNDTAFCQGGDLILDVSTPYGAYLWSTGETGATAWFDTVGTFSLTVSNPCGQHVSQINITEDSNLVVSLQDTLWLSSDSLMLEATGNAYYQWSNGDYGNPIWVSDSGTYYLTATNACGAVYDSVVVLSNLLITDVEMPSGLIVFPNPTTDLLTVRITEAGNVLNSYSMFSMDGKLLQTEKLGGVVEFPINLGSKQSGFYLCKLTTKHGDVFFKVLKL